jgi:hypothetical protein
MLYTLVSLLLMLIFTRFHSVHYSILSARNGYLDTKKETKNKIK